MQSITRTFILIAFQTWGQVSVGQMQNNRILHMQFKPRLIAVHYENSAINRG